MINVNKIGLKKNKCFLADITTTYDGYEWTTRKVFCGANASVVEKRIYNNPNYVHEDIGEEITDVYLTEIPLKTYLMLTPYLG